MKKVLGLLLIMFALPVFGALSDHSRPAAQAFNTVAVAGHTQAGGVYCTCGCRDCICDLGEVPLECANRPTPDKGKGKVDLSFDLGSALLLIALAWFYIRRV
jgi:hypothetical protein